MKAAKEQAMKVISRLPAEATWRDILYHLYVWRKIEEGIKAVQEGHTVPHDEVKRLFVQNND